MSFKGCPFCGNEPKVWDTEFGIANIIECKNCGVKFIFGWEKSGDDLEAAWNERSEKGDEKQG